MPDPRDDLVRRGDVRFIIESTVDIEDADVATLRSRLESLPADPVAVAALALAEALMLVCRLSEEYSDLCPQGTPEYRAAYKGYDAVSDAYRDAAARRKAP